MNAIQVKIDHALLVLKFNPNHSLLLVGKPGDGKINTLMTEHKLDVLSLSSINELNLDVVKQKKLVVLDEIDRACPAVLQQVFELIDIHKKQLILVSNTEFGDNNFSQLKNRCLIYNL